MGSGVLKEARDTAFESRTVFTTKDVVTYEAGGRFMVDVSGDVDITSEVAWDALPELLYALPDLPTIGGPLRIRHVRPDAPIVAVGNQFALRAVFWRDRYGPMMRLRVTDVEPTRYLR